MKFNSGKAVFLLRLGLLLVGRFGGVDFAFVAYATGVFRCIAFLSGCRGTDLERAATYGFLTGILVSLVF